MMDLFLQGRIAASDRAMKQAIERLSTGKRINRASDDPAGMIVATNFKTEIKEIEKSIEAAERHNHYLAAKEGSLSVIADMMIELQGITVQASNRGALGQGELEALQQQANGILDGIDFIAATARFNGELLLERLNAKDLGLRRLVASDDDDEGESHPRWFMDLQWGDLEAIQKAVDSASSGVNLTRAGIGAMIQRNESNIRLSMNQLESLSSEVSRIEDADYAEEISKLVRAQVLREVGMRSLMIHRESAGRALGLIGA
ncbi:MAG: hypothetical protein KF757_04745 [Phycisphaeraceae bacterium]|nr:hypothetical protein [Phycisphaeraceae bacterium]MCW5763922.1 hypothetical protein [Phycisphaeraceae bacterium]